MRNWDSQKSRILCYKSTAPDSTSAQANIETLILEPNPTSFAHQQVSSRNEDPNANSTRSSGRIRRIPSQYGNFEYAAASHRGLNFIFGGR